VVLLTVTQGEAIRDSEVAFDELSVRFTGMWIAWQRPEFTITADGRVRYSANPNPRETSRYNTEFVLRKGDLDQLVKLLRTTLWLKKTGANEQPGYTDASHIDIKLTYRGGSRSVWCHDRNPEPYLSLVNFLKRIQTQESLLMHMTSTDEQERLHAFREIDQGLRSGDGLPVAPPAHVPLDTRRFVPACMYVISHPNDNHHESLTTSLKLLGRLKTEQAQKEITVLTTATQAKVECDSVSAQGRSEYVAAAAVEALAALGGPQARVHIRDMAGNPERWQRGVRDALVEALLVLDRAQCADLLKGMLPSTSAAGWGLIRLGPQGVARIVDVLSAKLVPPQERMDQIYLIRQYIDHWKDVPKPLDERILNAVRQNWDYRLGSSSDWTQYHAELLELAGVPGVRYKPPSEIVQEFLQAVRSGNEAPIGMLVEVGSRRWPDWRNELRQLPDLQAISVTGAYVDRQGNMALVTAMGPGTGVTFYLNFMSGRVWRIGSVRIQTAEQTERAVRRFLEAHPNCVNE
jgi:hypothetical protein